MDTLNLLQPQVALSDPHMWTDARWRLNIRYAVSEALIRHAPGGFAPALAERWAVTSDARTWDFEIRQDVALHSGPVLSAQDVVAALDRARSPQMAGELGTSGLYRSYLGEATITTPRRGHVQLVLPEPMADLLDLLVEIPIVRQNETAGSHEQMVGTGPFRVVERGDGHLNMAAFDGYWGQRPATRLVSWLAEPDEGRRLEALLSGAAHLVTDLSASSRATIENSGRAQVLTQPSSTCVIFMCNAARGVCADRRVRQALNHALDVPKLIQAVRGGTAQPLNGPLTPLHLGHDPATPAYACDPARARALLAEAGYADGLNITLDVPTKTPDDALPLAELMAIQYSQVGMRAEVRVFEDRPGYAAMVKAKQIDDACCFDSSPLSTWRVLREKFHSGVAGSWWQGYSNPAVDRLLDEACGTVDPHRRQAVYRRAYRLIRDDAPWIFLYSPTLFWGIDSRAMHVTAGPDGVLRL